MTALRETGLSPARGVLRTNGLQQPPGPDAVEAVVPSAGVVDAGVSRFAVAVVDDELADTVAGNGGWLAWVLNKLGSAWVGGGWWSWGDMVVGMLGTGRGVTWHAVAVVLAADAWVVGGIGESRGV